MTKTILTAALLLTVGACAKPDAAPAADTTAAVPATPAVDPVIATAAAVIAKAIDAAPAKGDSILAANQFTAAAFEQLLYAIAADSSSAAAYKAEMERK